LNQFETFLNSFFFILKEKDKKFYKFYKFILFPIKLNQNSLNSVAITKNYVLNTSCYEPTLIIKNS